MTDPPGYLSAFQEALDRGQALSAQWRYDEARQVLRDLDDELATNPAQSAVTELRVHTLRGLATLASETTGDLGQSLALLEQASTLAADDPHLAAGVIRAEAFCQMRAGRTEAALTAFDRAERLMPGEPSVDRLRLHLNRGVLHLEAGSPDAARGDLEAAESEALALGEWVLAQKARHNLGSLAFLEGNLPLALERFASPVIETAEHPDVASILDDPLAHLDRARALSEVGLLDEADDMLVRAIVELDHSARHQDLGEAHLSRARVGLMTGDLDAAGRACEYAISHFDAGGNALWRRRADFTRLAIRLEVLQGEASKGAAPDATGHVAAAGLADEIATMTAAANGVGDGDIAVSAGLMLAEARLLAGDPGRARRALERSTPTLAAPVSVRLRWYRARAELAAITGRSDVQAIVDEGLVELGRAQSRLGSIDLRTAITIHGGELAELGVTDALGRGDPAVVHGAFERSHASSTRLAPVRVRTTEEESRDLTLLRRTEDALWRLDHEAEPRQADDLRRDKARLERQLRLRGWQRSGEDEQPAIVSLSETLDALSSAGAAAISFVAVGARLHGIVMDTSGLRPVPLGDLDHLLELVHQLRSDLQAVVLSGIPPAVRVVMRRSIVATLAALDRALLSSAGVGDIPLVVVPHGALGLVPWALLPSRRRAATTSTPCLTSWIRATERHQAGPGAAGDHDLDRSRVVAMAGPGLERATDEVAAVGRVWPGAWTATGDAATGASAIAALAGADIVHLAAHGLHQATSPLFSSVRLHDGPLFAHELDHNVHARLVVLSACEVGSQTVRKGDEPLGLTAALLQAGTPTVLAGLARVDDHLAHDVMVEVHRNLRASQSPAQALSAAMDAAMEDGHVAPFGCAGVGLAPLG